MIFKRIVVSFLLLAIWFFVADAYWTAKGRSVAKCANNPVSLGIILQYDENNLGFNHAKLTVLSDCSAAEGNGHGWFSARGMSYAEIVLLLPVASRMSW